MSASAGITPRDNTASSVRSSITTCRGGEQMAVDRLSARVSVYTVHVLVQCGCLAMFTQALGSRACRDVYIIDIHGYSWLFMDIHGYSWLFMAMQVVCIRVFITSFALLSRRRDSLFDYCRSTASLHAVCNCNNHSSECVFDPIVYEQTGQSSGGVCVACDGNTAGQQCETCAPFYFPRPDRVQTDPDVCEGGQSCCMCMYKES